MLTLQEKILGELKLTAIPNGVEKLVVTTATTLQSIPATGVRYALIEIESASSSDYIRYWCDGTLPTTAIGVKRGDGTAFDLLGPVAIAQFRVIGVGAGATLNIQYFR